MDSRKCRRWCKRILTRSSNASNKEWIKRTSQRAEWETNEWWKCERETLPVRVVCRKNRSVKQQRVRTRAWILSIEVQMLETEWIFHRVGCNRIQQNKFDEVQFLDLWERRNKLLFGIVKKITKRGILILRNNRKFSKVSMIGRIIGKRFTNVSSRIKRFLLKISLLQYRRLYDFSAVGRTVLFSFRGISRKG